MAARAVAEIVARGHDAFVFRRLAESPWDPRDVQTVFATLGRIEDKLNAIHAEVVGDDEEEEDES